MIPEWQERHPSILPSDWGAANWNTGAFDPETGMYYAV